MSISPKSLFLIFKSTFFIKHLRLLLLTLHINWCLQVFFKKGVLKNFANFKGKQRKTRKSYTEKDRKIHKKTPVIKSYNSKSCIK